MKQRWLSRGINTSTVIVYVIFFMWYYVFWWNSNKGVFTGVGFKKFLVIVFFVDFNILCVYNLFV